ncbi:hypothetical protein L7F22_031265 [Adiantum nelumboides]|nr:hypothetical protein [Adiantum nelumboides]
MLKYRGELSEQVSSTWGFCWDQFWGCYAAKILPDMCYTAGYRSSSSRLSFVTFPSLINKEIPQGAPDFGANRVSEHRSNEAKGKGHVVEQPPASIGHRQPSTHGLVNGQDSNEQTMRQTIPMPMSNAGCFGGGSVFQAMIIPSPALHGFMPDNAYGAMQAGSSNPMYGNIGVQLGFQCAAGSYGMRGANMGMAGFSQPDAQNLNMAGRPGGNFGSGMPLLNAPSYDNLTLKGKPKDYKEGGQVVKFDTFHGTHDKLKDLLVLQQFDAAFAGSASKQAHFVLVRKKIKSDHMVKLFMHNVFKYHGMPQSISEEANSTLLDLLNCYVSEHKATWKHYLPLVEYAYNNIVRTSTGKAPFEIVEGGKKVPPILHTKDKIFEGDKYVQNTNEAYKKIKLALEKTRSKQKKAVDRHRCELVFSIGDWVLLCFEKARLRKMKGKEHRFPKLGMRYYGPFQVRDKISDVTYRLKLPEDWKLHNAFHVSLLRLFVDDVPKDMVPEFQNRSWHTRIGKSEAKL